MRLFYLFIRDLFQVLPGRAREEWEQVNQLRPQLPTVILISGFAATKRSLSIIRKRLQRDGFNVLILAMDWQSLADGIRGLLPLALRLSTMILRIKKDRDLSRSPLYLVAHSAGGLVARYGRGVADATPRRAPAAGPDRRHHAAGDRRAGPNAVVRVGAPAERGSAP